MGVPCAGRERHHRGVDVLAGAVLPLAGVVDELARTHGEVIALDLIVCDRPVADALDSDSPLTIDLDALERCATIPALLEALDRGCADAS